MEGSSGQSGLLHALCSLMRTLVIVCPVEPFSPFEPVAGLSGLHPGWEETVPLDSLESLQLSAGPLKSFAVFVQPREIDVPQGTAVSVLDSVYPLHYGILLKAPMLCHAMPCHVDAPSHPKAKLFFSSLSHGRSRLCDSHMTRSLLRFVG